MTIDELIREAYATALDHGWHAQPRSFPESLLLLVSEIAEATEEYREHRGVNEIYFGTDAKPEGISIELADVIIRICDLCGAEGIDLEYALRIKLAYNKTRPWRHNNKKI